VRESRPHGQTLDLDDDRLVQRSLNVLLAKNQYEAVVGRTRSLGLDREEEPGLMLLDIGRPGRGGLAVLERLRGMAGLGGMPVIVVGANDATTERALSAGAEGFVLLSGQLTALYRRATGLTARVGLARSCAVTVTPGGQGRPSG
jgi:DNA-binding response OmpR family regulator